MVVQKDDDDQTASTESTRSQLMEETTIVEKLSSKQRKKEKQSGQINSNSMWTDLDLMCGGCCGAMEVIEPVEEEDPFAEDDNILSKFGHSILHKAGFAPPIKILRCTQLDDDTVITTPMVLIEMAKQYDKERFWVKGHAVPNDAADAGTFTTAKSNRSSMTSKSRRLLPSLSMSTRRTIGSLKSSRSFPSPKKSRKNKQAAKNEKPVKVLGGSMI